MFARSPIGLRPSGMTADKNDGLRKSNVMAGLGPAIHAFCLSPKDVDARIKSGHDGAWAHRPR